MHFDTIWKKIDKKKQIKFYQINDRYSATHKCSSIKQNLKINAIPNDDDLNTIEFR